MSFLVYYKKLSLPYSPRIHSNHNVGRMVLAPALSFCITGLAEDNGTSIKPITLFSPSSIDIAF